jgi:transposase InsO family protein
MNQKQKHDIKRKMAVIKHAEITTNVSKTCRYFGISRQTFYNWRNAYNIKGETGLINSKPCPRNLNLRTPKHIEDKVIYLRKTYHFGPRRISMYMERYHGIKISSSGARYVLIRNDLKLLPRNAKRRSPEPKFKRYNKQVPGHHVQVDVKFLTFNDQGNKIKRFQYTAIDDATRIRVIKIYPKHNQDHAIKFIDHVIHKMPFRINMVRTDNGHEFQARFHWHVMDQGIDHVYIKPGTPRLNGKVERSHRTDKEEFYQLIEFTDDVDLNLKLQEWQNFYNMFRPHMAHDGKTPYEMLRLKMKTNSNCKP